MLIWLRKDPKGEILEIRESFIKLLPLSRQKVTWIQTRSKIEGLERKGQMR